METMAECAGVGALPVEERPRLKPGPKPRGPRYHEADVLFDRTDLTELDALAVTLRRSRSDMVREAIKARLPKWRKEAREEGRDE